jgi:hypothetical protein
MSDLISEYTKSGLVSSPALNFEECHGCRGRFHRDELNDYLCADCELEDKKHRDLLNRKLRGELDMAEAKIKILEGIRDCYNELLAEVVNKYEGISRHDRAKAIIRSSEQMCSRGSAKIESEGG